METRKKYMANAWISILIYTALFLAILLPFDLPHWGLALKASLILGLFAAFLNEIIQQVRKLNGTGTPHLIRMTKPDGSSYTEEEEAELIRGARKRKTREEIMNVAAEAYLKLRKEGQAGKSA